MRILVIEDDGKVASFIQTGLEQEGYAVDVLNHGNTAGEQARAVDYDAVVLDLMLPGRSGEEILDRLRQAGKTTPVIVLTAKDLGSDRVANLNRGADDYLTKPFLLEELVAHIHALIRRAARQPAPSISVGDLRINLAARRVYKNEEEIELTGREYSILELLVRRRGDVVARTTLSEHLYSDDSELMSNAIDVHVASLRRKLGAAVIQTRRGLGYLIDG